MFDIEPRDQRRGDAEIKRIAVIGRIAEPVAAAAARHVDADDAVMCRQRLRDNIEVARVAGEAVDAKQSRRLGRPGPFHIGDAVEAVRAEAVQGAFDHDATIAQGSRRIKRQDALAARWLTLMLRPA